MRFSIRRLAGVLAVLALASGACAPPPPPRPAVNDRAALYRAGRARREVFLSALTADVVLRLDGRSIGRLPALSASLSLASPDRVRFVADALIGVAVDACARGDSLVVWVPSERTAFVLGAAEESLAVGPPVELFARTLGATWDPPSSAWSAARSDTSGLVVSWRSAGDSLALVVGDDGLPLSAEVRRGGESVRVRYGTWSRVQGESWPARVELTDGRARVRLRLEIDDARVSARPDEQWFAQRIPPGARRLDWPALRALLREGGAIR